MRVLTRTRLEVAYTLAFLLVVLNFSAVAQGELLSSRPTFNCAKAKSPLALLICSGEEAARADWNLRIASWARYFSLAEDDRATFWEDQDKWLKSLNQKCRLTNSPPFSRQQTSCVIEVYRGRAALYRSKLTGDALAESKLTPEQLAAIQQALIALGFLGGETDGEFGSVTRAAIRKYQEANGFPQSDYLSMEQRRALLEGRADRPAIAQSNAREDNAIGETSPARQGTPAGQPRAGGQQRAAGEFARLVEVPADCQIAREFGKSGRWKSQLFHLEPQVGRPGIQVPGPACQAAESCFQAMKAQAAAGVAYLTRNPAVSDALTSQLQAADPRSRSTTSVTLKLQQLLATYSGTSWGPYDRCIMVWTTVDSHWFQLTELVPTRGSRPFEEFSIAGKALLQAVRDDYARDESEYRQLVAFNDRYTGLERLERAQASYRQAFQNDDIGAMIRERPAVLQGLEQATARKQLLTQQSGQIAQYEQTLADFVTAVDREGLTGFVDQQTKTAMGERRGELARLSQTAPGKRGDISAKLEIFATRIRDIDSAIGSARSMKTQAEQTRRMLVESEGEARRVLDAASEELKEEILDAEFRNSVNELIKHFRDLESSDLWVIPQRQEDIDSAKRNLAVLQKELEQARARKQLLTQQSAQIAQYEQTLAGFVTAVDREGLTGFADQQTQTAMGELRGELARLSQTALGKRGDISAKLEIFGTRIRDIDSAIGSARSMKTQAEQTRRMLIESEGEARRVLDAAASEELKGAFDEEFRTSTNELINRFRDLESNDLRVIPQRQEDIDAARRNLAVLENQISDARAKYDRAKKLDGMRQVGMQKIAGALSELAQPEIRGKLANDGLAVIASLKSFQDTLSGFDTVRLINRPDYTDTLAASDNALAKAQQFKGEIVEIAQLVNDLQELNIRIDRRGRRFLDGPTSSMVADIGKSVSTLSSARIPLSSESRLQLSNTRVALNRIPDVVDNVMDREEKRILRREMPSQRGIWRFSFDEDKMTDEERVKAFARIESSQAKYDLTVTCGKRGGELVIATFEPVGTDPKRIPWNSYGPKSDRDIRLRIDSNPAFPARLEMRGYVNQGQVISADSAQLENLLHSSRLVFSDVFPEEQVDVATAYPAQFTRLCELVGTHK